MRIFTHCKDNERMIRFIGIFYKMFRYRSHRMESSTALVKKACRVIQRDRPNSLHGVSLIKYFYRQFTHFHGENLYLILKTKSIRKPDNRGSACTYPTRSCIGPRGWGNTPHRCRTSRLGSRCAGLSPLGNRRS